jgi:hypothetical protein
MFAAMIVLTNVQLYQSVYQNNMMNLSIQEITPTTKNNSNNHFYCQKVVLEGIV